MFIIKIFTLHNYVNMKVPFSVHPCSYHFTEVVTVKLLVFDTPYGLLDLGIQCQSRWEEGFSSW